MRIDSSVAALLVKDNKAFYEAGIKLKLGEVIDTEVLEVLDDKVLLNIKGEIVSAKTFTGISEKGSIKLVYMGEQDGEIRFKVKDNGVKPTAIDSLLSALEELGVRGTDKNLAIANRLIESDLPVTKANISKFESILPSLDSQSFDTETEFAVLLLKNNLPVTRETMGLVNYVKEGNIAAVLQGLEQVIDSVSERPVSAAYTDSQSSNILPTSDTESSQRSVATLLIAGEDSLHSTTSNVITNTTPNTISSIILNTMDTGAHKTVQNTVKNTVSNAANNAESNEVQNTMLDKVAESALKSSELKSSEGPVSSMVGTDDSRGQSLSKILEFLNALSSDGSKGDVEHILENLTKDNVTVKLFDVLEKLSTHSSLSDAKDTNIQEHDSLGKTVPGSKEAIVNSSAETNSSQLKDSIVNLIKGFSKEALINTDKGNNFESTNTYLNIPLKINDQWYPASLQIKTDYDENKGVSFDKKVYVSINVETKHLDRVNVKLEVLKSKAICSICVVNDEGYKVFSKSIDELKIALSDTYEQVEVKVLKTETESSGLTNGDSTKKDGGSKYSRVDFRI